MRVLSACTPRPVTPASDSRSHLEHSRRFTAVLTLYTTPVVYHYLEKIRVSVNRRRGHTVADEVVPDGRVADAGLPARHG